MMEYVVGNDRYGFSYQECREHYDRLCAMSNEDFMKHLPEALHLAIFVAWVKETPSEVCLRDDGVIHQLAHRIQYPKGGGTLPSARDLRRLFKRTCFLSP